MYDAFHTYAWPRALVAIGAADGLTIVLSMGLIWVAHIGMDRAAGYGSRYADRFGHTHLGILGCDRRS